VPAGALRVSIGRDPRLSSPLIAASLASGLAAAGVSVARFGPCTTPAMFMSCILPGARGSALWRAAVGEVAGLVWVGSCCCCCRGGLGDPFCHPAAIYSAAAHPPTQPPSCAADHMYDGAVMITASHLPPNRNGAKFCTAEVGGEVGALLLWSS
jgi:phosphomannomutase